MRYWWLVVALTSVLLFGCEEFSQTNILQQGKEAAVVSYVSFLSNCSTVYDINYSSVEGVCGGRENVLTSWVGEDNWSITCCNLNSKCYEEDKANFTDLCVYNTSQSSFSWQYVDGSWVGLCCDFSSGLCYQQSDVQVGSNATCQTNFSTLIATVSQNSSLWNSWCCVSGGLEI
jgi:hypothetical protein